MTASAEIRGMARRLGNAPDRMVQGVRQATGKTTLDTLADSRRNAPVDTAYLRNSGSVHIEPGGPTTPVVGEVRFGADYARHVEDGTENMAPRPYLRPAMEKHAPAWEQALGQLGLEVLE